jgi:chloramphenicol O-acetyltransferase
MERMKRIEEFSLDGKNFMYIDFSDFKTNDDFSQLITTIESLIAKYPEDSLYTITNIENIRFDSKSMKIVAKNMEHNKPYVKYGVVIGLDGIKKVMLTTVMKMSGRNNMHYAFSKEKAIEWLLALE